MISSITDGRIRIKTNRLKNKRVSDSIKGKVEALNGVSAVRTNPGASSIVVHFNKNQVDIEQLENEIFELCSPPKANKKSKPKISRRVNQASKIGMMATLSASLVYGFMGKKKPHIYYGSAFVGLAGLHMLKHSKSLIK